MNRKGEVFTATLVIVLAAALASFATAQWGKYVGLGSPQAQKSRQISKEVHVTRPYILAGQDGKPIIGPDKRPVVLYEKQDMLSSADIMEEQKLTLWQRMMMLPKIIAVLSILGIIFPAFGIWLLRTIFKLKSNFTQVVKGIELAKKELPPESIAKLETNLSRKADESTKQLVKKVKVKLD